MTKERIAIVKGVRTPFCKAGGVLKDYEADDLGAIVVRELLSLANVNPRDIDELIFGNVIQPPDATNIARVLSVKGGLPEKTPAFTVNRNCASGLESITTAANKLLLGQAKMIIAGGTESMSRVPVLFPNKMRDFLMKLMKARSFQEKFSLLFKFRFGFLMPRIPSISDPICGLSMGQTAEILSRDFHVTRQEQDAFSLKSQQRALAATREGRFAEEIVPITLPPKFNAFQEIDDGPRENTTLEALLKLKPAFDKLNGSVTAGNSSQVTDGAAAVLLMTESRSKELGLEPLGYLVDFSVAALDPSKMGLGPAYAIPKLLEKNGLTLSDIDLFEINEAFAAQVLAVKKALASPEFSKQELGRTSPVGEIDEEKLNVNGGAIALGHPVGTSGTRLVLTVLKELKRRGKNRAIVSLCVGGGQGEAALLELN